MDHNLMRKLKQKVRHLTFCVTLIFISLILMLVLWTDRKNEVTAPRPLPAKCARKYVPREQKVPFVEVSGTKTLLLSAYMEHRRRKQVRVIAVVLRNETPAYRCQFCCNDKLHTSEGVSEIHSDHFGFAYGTADIMCPLPSHCETPSHVAVSSVATNYEDLRHNLFLEVKNQKVESVSLTYNFTTCISTMFNFTNVLQMVQSLEMMRLLGVDRVVVYKSSCSPETQRVLDYYTKKGLIEVIPWTIARYLKPSQGWLPSHGPGDLHYYGQIAALTDCLYRYMYQTRYVALQDIDELILPQSVNSWFELLPLLEEKYGVDKCYMFENNVFPNSVALPLPASENLPSESLNWHKVPGVNILEHLHHEPIIAQTQYYNFKIIVNPRAVYRPTVHGLLDSEKGCSWIDRNIARMQHTRPAVQQKLKPEQLIFDNRLLSYSARLTSAVNTVLTETEFLRNQDESS
ncbi:uncharacterized protein si:zfos-464b6.2 isoform X1 [Thunnus albacares]|uniref:uncharacterized protein si:zfos-464b6.2 isoform X1 n=2 Tax=Thunnus albacares TaxID=8236 RepID=UPI001CF6704C|nr:uncharacterized protein si:zfos-464b6.2 isoform X1 [Thunnus albacares]XP_044209521.1 uncharacterized protein si:zfos-464b6.2 isoform X1 [Thunnus albacares]